MEKQANRISVSFGQKLNMGNYESRDLHISFSTDLDTNETPEQGYARASKLVKELLNAELALARPKKP